MKKQIMQDKKNMKNTTPVALTLAALAAALAVNGCAKLQDDDEDAISMGAESAIGSLNSALSDSEQGTPIASNGFRPGGISALASRSVDFLIPSANASACGLNVYSPALGNLSCAGTSGNKTVTATFNGCSVGLSGDYLLSGSIQLAFDSSATCDSWIDGGALPTSGNLVRTMSSLVRSNPNGSSVTMSSSSHPNYLGQTISGGVMTTFGAGSRQVDVLGLHRVRSTARGIRVFDHSVKTLSPIVASGTQALGTRTVSSGQIRVDHNIARYSMTTTLSGLSWSSSCCHPVAGSMTFSLSGSLSGTVRADFATGVCGAVNFTAADGSVSKIELAACN